jgi:prephenate dehydrogenase
LFNPLRFRRFKQDRDISAAQLSASNAMPLNKSIQSIGIMGFGAFGRLIEKHLKDHFEISIHDPSLTSLSVNTQHSSRFCDVKTIAQCDLVILAVPVQKMTEAIHQLNPHLQVGTVVVDVGSVKLKPVEIMQNTLPHFVDIVGTHPLFGPQSAKDGITNLKIAVCPVRGNSSIRVAAFLKKVLGLQVFITTPDKHDRDAAMVQGLTHLIARILLRMEPFPEHLTTTSFDLLVEAIGMVRHDSESVYQTIEKDNPHANTVRDQFFEMANEILQEIEPDKGKRAYSLV